MNQRRFRWGVSTSAYQIEGARFEDGKGESIWDRFYDDGHMAAGGDVACDHYHRLDDDLDLLASLGVDAYHFSIAWTRVLPDGDGEANQVGLDFYRRLVAGLRERGIEAWPTLYHWDLPQALQERGGWANRSTVDAFNRYADVVSSALGDVGHWMTHNEPWVSAYLGHLFGVFAPGLTDWDTALRAAHHLLLSHGTSLQVIKENRSESQVGLALDCRPARPATDEDHEATQVFDGFRNRWFFDPVFGRGYPDDMLSRYHDLGRLSGSIPDFVHEGDLEIIGSPIDFLGLNYYTTTEVRRGSEERDDPEREPGPDPLEGFTEMGWAIDPRGLGDYLIDLNETYQPPSIIVTENGASFSDGPVDGAVEDRRRVEYLASHIDEMTRARESGVPVDGYFVWSFLDNLEWTQGFDQRFGLVWVDHQSQLRIPKGSYHWYRDRIRQGP